jgi:hypothetical protein
MSKTFAFMFRLLNIVWYAMMEPRLLLQEFGNMRMGIESLFECMIVITLPI